MPDNIVISPSNITQYKGVNSVLIKASDQYMAGTYRKFILGKNYRKAWDAPIKVPVIWLDTMHGGLKPVRAGGGGQTRSLVLEDKHGHKFALRTVNKDALHSMPSFGKVLGLKNMVLDGISAGHPYAALPVAKLCEAAGIIHTQPALVFVPEQASLDSFNHDFGNRLYTLEYEQEGENADWTSIKNASATLESEEVMEEILEHPAYKIDQKTLLTARLLDLIIYDWDRHPGNWGWVAQKNNDGVKYIPFPVDRDMAFYAENGVAPWIYNRNGAMGKFRRYFRSKNYLKAAFNKARFIDPAFLNEMTREDFLNAATELQHKLTDEQIRTAFEVWPDTIYKLDAERIIDKIIIRRDKLLEYAEVFYEYLAASPQILGTNSMDSFVVYQPTENQVAVEVHARNKNGEYSPKYKRIFLKEETKELNLFAMDGDDSLIIDSDISIPINFQGGEGMDKLEINKKAKNANKMVRLIDKSDGFIAPANIKTKKKKTELMIPRA